MNFVKPKKHLGQHFLTDLNIAEKIALSLTGHNGYKKVLEVGPGTGVLTTFLLKNPSFSTFMIDIDKESITYLHKHFPEQKEFIIEGDFLRMDLQKLFSEPIAVAGNFPYNISSQIFFKVLEYRDQVQEVVGMVQKEVGQRLVSPPGNKDYGILSVLLQAFYTPEYLFSVPPHVFNPPPKVNSAVVRFKRNNVQRLDCDEKLFFRVVKQGFQNRRKTLRNALKVFNLNDQIKINPILDKRAEQLSVSDFVGLTNLIEGNKN